MVSGGVRVRFRVRFQAAKVPICGGFPVENPTKKATASKALLRGISLSEYGAEGFRVRLRRLSEYGSVAHFVERPTRETRAEQYSDTVLWSGVGSKGLLNRGSEKTLAPVQPGVAQVQNRVAQGARDSQETFAPWVQKTFCSLS